MHILSGYFWILFWCFSFYLLTFVWINHWYKFSWFWTLLSLACCSYSWKVCKQVKLESAHNIGCSHPDFWRKQQCQLWICLFSEIVILVYWLYMSDVLLLPSFMAYGCCLLFVLEFDITWFLRKKRKKNDNNICLLLF